MAAKRPKRREGDGHADALEANGGALNVSSGPDGVRFGVRVQPRSAHEGVAGVRGGVLCVRLNAPPVGGAANSALLKLLGRWLQIAPSTVTIIRGLAGKNKVVRVAGVTAGLVAQRAANGDEPR
jgi:uncharacterized protein